jgi:hypothetical protein
MSLLELNRSRGQKQGIALTKQMSNLKTPLQLLRWGAGGSRCGRGGEAYLPALVFALVTVDNCLFCKCLTQLRLLLISFFGVCLPADAAGIFGAASGLFKSLIGLPTTSPGEPVAEKVA